VDQKSASRLRRGPLPASVASMPDGEEEAAPPASSEVAPAAETAGDAPGDAADAANAEAEDAAEDDGPITVLWCSGDAPGSTTQHNFEGVWNMSDGEPLINGRPHYEHMTPDQTPVHLFFVEHQTDSPAGRAPRWMIGPSPGNGVNGWAYADSDATGPADIVEPWLAWLKETSSWGEARLAFKERSSGLGAEAEEEDDEDGEAEGVGDTPSPAGGGAPKKKKKKKKAAAGGALPKAGGSPPAKSGNKKSARKSARSAAAKAA